MEKGGKGKKGKTEKVIFNSFEDLWALLPDSYQQWLDKNVKTSKTLQNSLQKDKASIARILWLNIDKSKDWKMVDMLKKIQGMLDKALLEASQKEVADFTESVDFSKRMMKNWVYKWIIAQKNKDGIIVSIGSKSGNPIEYELLYKDLPKWISKKKLSLTDEIFIDLEKLEDWFMKINYATKKDFHKPLMEELDRLWLTINWYKPVFYMTKSGKPLTGKIVSLGDDVFGEQVVFQTKDWKQNFPISIAALKEWMFQARKAYQKKSKLSKSKKPAFDKTRKAVKK